MTLVKLYISLSTVTDGSMICWCFHESEFTNMRRGSTSGISGSMLLDLVKLYKSSASIDRVELQ